MNTSKKVACAVAGLLALLFLCSLTQVPVGATGVVKTLGAVSGKTLSSGVRFRVPFFQSVVDVDNQIQKLEVNADAVSKDMQAVSARVAVNFKVLPAASVGIVKEIGADAYRDSILAPAVQECVKATTAQFTAEELISARARVGADIAAAIEAKVADYGINVQAFNIVNFDFSDEFNAAIEAKQVAQQELIRAKTEQEQLVVKAEAAAKAAAAEAEAILVKAQAQAEANRKLAESLTDALVEYEKIKKWDGALPKASGGSAIVDFRQP